VYKNKTFVVKQPTYFSRLYIILPDCQAFLTMRICVQKSKKFLHSEIKKYIFFLIVLFNGEKI